jgi:hypothetical protein
MMGDYCECKSSNFGANPHHSDLLKYDMFVSANGPDALDMVLRINRPIAGESIKKPSNLS